MGGASSSPPIGPSTTATITFNAAVEHPTLGTSTTWSWPADGDIILTANTAERTFITDTTFTATTKIWGASGGPCRTLAVATGGGGGAAVADITFEAGVTYRMVIGLGGITQGSTACTAVVADRIDPPSYISGAGRGGGAVQRAAGNSFPGNGGGYTGIFYNVRNQSNALLIAAGGGGAGAQSNTYTYAGRGGAGGGTTGQNGAFANDPTGTAGAPGATATAGGSAGTPRSGTALQGGHSRLNTAPYTVYGVGGGGGGGYWGGASGDGSNLQGGSGGGGGAGRASSNTSRVNNATLYTGNGRTPGNDSDPDRGATGNFASATWGNVGWGTAASTYSPGGERGNGLILIKYPG